MLYIIHVQECFYSHTHNHTHTYTHTHCAVLNKYRKRRIHNTANLLTGESDVAPGSMKVAQGDTVTEADIISYYHPNLTVCLVEDYTRWVKGSVPQPLDNC